MRVVITGGAGFLGSHLCEQLILDGHDVVCIDNLSTGRTDNIGPLLLHRRFTFMKYDVCEFLHVDGAVDAVMHFASPASPQDYLEMPIATMKVGAMGTHKALGLAKAKQARFLLASTSKVYGDPLINPQHEAYWGNVNPISPRGVYDEAKRFAESLTMAYHRYHGLDTRIARIFNTYGPRMRPHDGRVVSNFVIQALRGEPLTVFGTGAQTRSLCFVDDLVRGILRLLMIDSDRPLEARTDRRFLMHAGANRGGSIHEPINIGNPHELTVKEIATLVLKLVGSDSRIEFRLLPIDGPKVKRPDISRAKRLLGWEPEIELEDGLVTTIEHFAAAMSTAEVG